MKNSNDTKYGFWGILATKAKSILEEENQIESSPTKINKFQLNNYDSTSTHQVRHAPFPFRCS